MEKEVKPIFGMLLKSSRRRRFSGTATSKGRKDWVCIKGSMVRGAAGPE